MASFRILGSVEAWNGEWRLGLEAPRAEQIASRVEAPIWEARAARLLARLEGSE